MLTQAQIRELIPHRPPFLWIDSIAELEPGVRCTAVRFLDPADPVFAGHFPGNAIFPGVLIIEAAAQTAGVMLGGLRAGPGPEQAEPAAAGTPLLAAVNRFKFFRPVKAGSVLRIETRKIAAMGAMAYIEAVVWVGDESVAKGELAVVSP